MLAKIAVLMAAAVIVLLSGCAQVEPGTEQILGQVTYAEAFDAARTVMNQYFTVALADPGEGLIRSAPKELRGRVLGGGVGRQVATVRIRQEPQGIVARATVNVQRQGSSALRMVSPQAGASGEPPRQTPAELEAATTPEQNESWITERRDRGLEQRILSDILNALRPKAPD